MANLLPPHGNDGLPSSSTPLRQEPPHETVELAIPSAHPPPQEAQMSDGGYSEFLGSTMRPAHGKCCCLGASTVTHETGQHNEAPEDDTSSIALPHSLKKRRSSEPLSTVELVIVAALLPVAMQGFTLEGSGQRSNMCMFWCRKHTQCRA